LIEIIPQIKYTNFRNRPIGLGIQDLAGCFALMDYCWDSIEAAELNKKIAKVMYYHAMDESIIMAKKYGKYETFEGSPASKGLLQFDLWDIEELEKQGTNVEYDLYYHLVAYHQKDEFDWSELRKRMKEDGLYFSLIFSQMPTASSAHILGNNESIEPYTQLLFSRSVLSGQFVISVPHFVRDFSEIGMWNDDLLKHLFENQGSIQTFEPEISPDLVSRFQHLKNKYKTAFELSQKTLANLYIDRSRYQCQSTSFNVFMKDPNITKLNAYLFHVWGKGAKTAIYYLRTPAGTSPLNFTLDATHVSKKEDEIVCQSCQC
jgi:ribonucleotide reductase alpha subunit